MRRHASAHWEGDLKSGKGTVKTQSGVLENQSINFNARFEDEEVKSATNPEELIAAAHASCFAMQLSHFLAENGTPAKSIDTTAKVNVSPSNGGFAITHSALQLAAEVPGIEPVKFRELADKAKTNCPVSKALGAIDITLESELR